jgi:ribose 5-phosphate isomerase RpiB
MIVTARQLEDLHRQSGSNGHVTLPYRARLTPLASDWVRSKKVVVGYGDAGAPAGGGATFAKPQAAKPAHDAGSSISASHASDAGAFVWWCDGPCGPAKAAVIAHEREASLRALDKPTDSKQLVGVLKAIAADVRSGRIQGAILLVQNGALATVFANRCPSLRAIIGTSLEAVDQGVQQAGANVLIIEHPQKTLQQVKNLLGRFTRGKRGLSEEMQRQLNELAACG